MNWGAVLPAVGTAISSALGVREAAKNRAFQERMSSSAHQREAEDLRRANINPALSARLGGSSTPGGAVGQIGDFGAAASSGISSALAVKLSRAQISLIESQADAASAQASLSRTQAADISNTAAAGRLELISIQRDLANQEYGRIQQQLPDILARARAEVQQLSSSARQASANALLLELESGRAANLNAIQRQLEAMGPLGPWVNVIIDLLRAGRIPR